MGSLWSPARSGDSDLVRISHWTSDEVAREHELKEEAKNIEPNYIARDSFAQVLTNGS
jgi:hypothetical protein